MAVSLGVTACIMNIRRVAVKQSNRRVVKLNDLERRTVFDLHAQQSLGDQGQIHDAAKPTADDAAHARATGILAIGPASDGSRLREANANLSSADIEPSGPLKCGYCGVQLASGRKFFP